MLHKWENLFDKTFVLIEAVIYICFMYVDIFGGSGTLSENLKYTGIILCAIAAVYGAFSIKSVTAAMIAAAMLFTAIADAFLLKSDVYLPGIISFAIVQTLYLVMLERNRKKKREIVIHIISAAAAAVIAGYLLRNIAGEDCFMIGVAVFYGVSFIRNIALGALGCRDGQNTEIRPRLFLAGLVVFLLCDINVLLYNLPGYIDIKSNLLLFLLRFAGDFMWMFYLPAQVMIVKSIKTTQKVKVPVDNYTQM